MNLSCRICLLKVESANCTDVFSKSNTNELVSDMIKNFASIEIYEADNLPKVICATCLLKLYDVFEFKKLIVASDLHLKRLLKDEKVKSEELTIQAKLIQLCEVKAEKDDSENEDEWFSGCVPQETKPLNKLEDESKSNMSQRRMYSCPDCNMSFKSKYSCAAHRISHTGIAPFNCEFCSKKFPTNWSLTVHKRKHSETRPFKCKICDKSFKFSSGLITHKKLHQGLKPYQCNTCGKTFATKGTLQTHENIHTKEKKYICEICSKIFYSQSSFSNHLKTHKKLTVLCPICGKSYAPKGLGQHIKTHTTVRSFKCAVCEKSLTTNTALKIHMRIHNDVKPYTCEICGKSFRQLSVITLHRRVHTGETPFACKYCEKRFAYKHHLKKHVAKVHPKESAEMGAK